MVSLLLSKMAESTGANKTRVVLFVFLMLVYLIISDFLPSYVPAELHDLVAVGAFFLVLFLMYITVVVFLGWEGVTSTSSLGLDTDSNTMNQLVLGGVIGAIGGLVVYLCALFFGGTLRAPAEINLDLIVSEIIITTPVAFVEELAYRGYLLTRMDLLWGKRTALIGSSVIFSLLHFSWWVPLGSVPLHLILIFSLNMFLGGLVLSVAYYLSGRKLWAPIGFHFTWNILAYVAFPSFPHDPVPMPEIFQIEWGITTVAAFLFALSLIYMLLPLVRSRAQKTRTANGSRRGSAA